MNAGTVKQENSVHERTVTQKRQSYRGNGLAGGEGYKLYLYLVDCQWFRELMTLFIAIVLRTNASVNVTYERCSSQAPGAGAAVAELRFVGAKRAGPSVLALLRHQHR